MKHVSATTHQSNRRGTLGSLPAVVGTLLVVAGGFVHGMWTGRWEPADRTDAVSRLNQIPEQIADWVLIETGTVSEAEQQMAELSGYTLRHYRNQRTGDVVTMLLMCGPPGPVAVHPPTACYTGRGYEQIGASVPHDVALPQAGKSDDAHAFMTARFHKPGSHSAMQPCIYWGWSTQGDWSVPSNPRVEYAGASTLFKLYVTCESAGVLIGTDDFPPAQFLRDVIPVLKSSVFEPASASLPNATPETHSR